MKYKRYGKHLDRLYNIYNGIKTRCFNKNHHSFKNYGGRGIKLFWNSFTEFEQDMRDSYNKHIEEFGEKETTIDRIDNNGHYCKENCRWNTRRGQVLNYSRTNFIKIGEETKHLKEWCKHFGISDSLVVYRIKSKWPLEQVFSKPNINRSKFHHDV